MAALNLQAIASYSSMRLIDSLVEGLVVCLFAALLLQFSKRQNAGTRFAIGFSALLAIAFFPLLKGIFVHEHFSAGSPAVVVPESWAVYLFSAWAVVAMLLLARVVRSVWHLRKIRASCVELDPTSIDPLVADTLSRKQGLRKVLLCASDRVRVPTALGLIRPAIVIPRWVLQELSANELNQVVLHELAHLRRWDDWTNLAQQIVKAFFFFQPAVWWIENKIALEREVACDDAVLAETESPRAYAECLARLAERTFVQRSVALAQALLGRIAQTSQRVAQILDVRRPRGNARAWKPAVTVMVGVGFLWSVWAARTPELVGFGHENSSSTQFASSMPERVGVPITNARLIQRTAAERPNIMPTPAKLRRKPVRQQPDTNSAKLALQHQNRRDDLIHLTAVTAEQSPVTNTVFVVIEQQERDTAGSQIYHIQMWRLTVLPVERAIGSKTPSKQT